MAMPSVIPPPPPTIDEDLVEEVLALAQKMADSVGHEIGDVLRRTKSRNWMVGRLRKSGLWSDNAIRAALEEQRKNYRPTISDELERRPVELTSRRPLVFHEAADWPCWGPRVEQLGALVVYPMTILELSRRAKVVLAWDENRVKQTTAAAESANELWYDRAFLHWHRTAERIVMTDPKKKTKIVRLQRRLLVQLKPEDQAALKDRLRGIKAEKAALELELAETARSLKARIREREEAADRTVTAMLDGQEVQSVDCEERWDYGQKQVVTVRKDTGDVVDAREMTKDELQVPIPEAVS